MSDLLLIDGSQGEGGGQILRSSLALSLVTGRPFKMENIRANRKKPGLMRQHLTAVKAAATISGSVVSDVEIGSQTLVFEPGSVSGGNYTFHIGSAGSASLVLQTVLPALMMAKTPSVLTIIGGTHNPMAPPFDFLQKVFTPFVNRLGPNLKMELIHYGFFPAGGGEIRVHVQPAQKLGPLQLLKRGELISRQARILDSRLPEQVVENERKLLLHAGWSDSEVKIEKVLNSHGSGNVIMLQLQMEEITEMFTAFGIRGVPAQRVVQEVVDRYRLYWNSKAPVGEFLADQLLLPLGIAAWQNSGTSEFLTGPLSGHTVTHMEILRQFLDINITVKECSANQFLVQTG
ncbi:MAG: RNA 3'-terminal phosphate cyclase [Planctomycetia bacterium]|nr:RNA 3'-terminal phosphate cyclase [Planctomycetia bacterium]